MIALQLLACTLDAGDPWVALAGGEVSAAFAPGARELPEGGVVSDLAATWRLDGFEVELAAVELVELQGAGGVEFDPASPPPGYSLCHGGHCHAEDGSLVDYSDIVAELSGGRATFVPVSGWTPAEPLDLLAGARIALGDPDLSALPEVTLARAEVRLTSVRLAGEVGAEGLAPVPFTVEVDALTVSADLPFEVGRDAPARVRFTADWPVDGTLLDGLDVAALSDAGTLDAALAVSVPEALSVQPLSAKLVEVP